MKPEAVVFDVGNVLIEWFPENYYDALVGPERRRAFFEAVPMEEINERSDAGESLFEIMAEAAGVYPDWSREIRAWSENFMDICTPAIEGTVATLRALRDRGVPVFALSNFGAETFELARAEYPFLDLFDQRFVSGHLKCIKPHPPIYEALESGTGYSGAQLLFVDDRADNIDAARARGWQAHHFQGAVGWQTALADAGLLD